MFWKPPSTTTRGSTLVEVLVASTLFVGMAAIMALLMRQNQLASQKVIGKSDTTAAMLMVFERIRTELRGARVVGVNATGGLEYWISRKVDGVVQLTPNGFPDWIPGAPADPDVALLQVDNGILVRDFQGDRQPLVPVGPDGAIVFVWDMGNHTLMVAGAVGEKHGYRVEKNNYETFRYYIQVGNNE